MNVSLSLAVALPIVFSEKILITSGVFSAYAAARLSSQASAHLNQVTGLSWLGDSSSKMQSH